MQIHRALISDSVLIQETLELVRASGGAASVVSITDNVLKLPALAPDLAALLVSDLIATDARLRLKDQATVELAHDDTETRDIHATDFVVVDVETTGAKVPPGRITEIGAYRISRQRIVAEFTTLVNPEINIPPFIVSLTGITNAMVRDAPKFAEVAHDWLNFAADAALVAHNAPFDLRFLNHEIGRLFPGKRMANPHLCTVSLSRRLLPDLINHRLQTVAAHYRAPLERHHRAASDARATAEIFLHMLAHMRQHGVSNLAEARQFRVGRSN